MNRTHAVSAVCPLQMCAHTTRFVDRPLGDGLYVLYKLYAQQNAVTSRVKNPLVKGVQPPRMCGY